MKVWALMDSGAIQGLYWTREDAEQAQRENLTHSRSGP